MSQFYRAMKQTGKYECLRLRESQKQRSQFKFKDHQQTVIDYCSQLPEGSNQRGVLLYHTLGLGKTCTSIGIADALLKSGDRFNEVAIFLPAALRVNFVKEYCSKCGDKAHLGRFKDLVTFYAYNDTGIIKKLPPNLDKKVIIVDEIHNLISGKRNQSKIKTFIYNLINGSRNSFIIGLSGTPIYGSTYELVLLQRLLKRKSALDSALRGSKSLKEEIDSWYQLVEEDPDLVVKAAKNTISYVEPTDFDQYPSVRLDRYVMTPFSQEMEEQHDAQVEKENNILKFQRRRQESDLDFIARMNFMEEEAGKKSGSLEYLALTRFFSRRVSIVIYPSKKQQIINLPVYFKKRFTNLNDLVDFFYGINQWDKIEPETFAFLQLEEIVRPSDRKKIENGMTLRLSRKTFDQDPTPVMTDHQLMTLDEVEINQKLVQSSVKMLTLGELPQYSPKLRAMYSKIRGLKGKHVIYCQFKENYGVYLISAFLTLHGISNLTYTGDQDEKTRDQYLEWFNHIDNLNGDRWKVLLLTDAGVEGLSIMASQYMHILSPQIIQNKVNQVIGRIRRLNSHKDLPLSRRNVSIFRYLSVFNEDFHGKEFDVIKPLAEDFGSRTQELMNNISLENQRKMEQAQEKGLPFEPDEEIAKVSIDQQVNELSLTRERNINQVLQLMQQARLEDRDEDDDISSVASSEIESEEELDDDSSMTD